MKMTDERNDALPDYDPQFADHPWYAPVRASAMETVVPEPEAPAPWREENRIFVRAETDFEDAPSVDGLLDWSTWVV